MRSRSPGMPTTLLISMGGCGVMEDDDVAAPNRPIGQEPAAKPAGGRVDLLVEEQKIADQQRALHAFRGNEERLQDKGEHKQRHHHGLQQRGQGLRQGGQMRAQVRQLAMRRMRRAALERECSLRSAAPLPRRQSNAGVGVGAGCGRCRTVEIRQTARARGALHPVRRCFLVRPMPRASGFPALPASPFSRTSTRKRL